MPPKKAKKSNLPNSSYTELVEPGYMAGIVDGISRLGIGTGPGVGTTASNAASSRSANLAFAQVFGNNGSKLEGWQEICATVGIDPPHSVTQCKKALKNVHVGIFDLVDALRRGNVVPKSQIFHNHYQLANYLQSHRKRMFPKHIVKQNMFLKEMLREVS